MDRKSSESDVCRVLLVQDEPSEMRYVVHLIGFYSDD